MNTLIPEKPQILGKQLQAARESLALTVEDVTAELELDPSTLLAWESQASEPPLKELWRLADFYGRKVDYFLTITPPIPPLTNFRVSGKRSMDELPLLAKQIIVQFEELCRAATRLLELAEEGRKILVVPQKDVHDPIELAVVERARIGLDSRPVKDLRRRIENQGVWTFELTVPANVFSGFSWWHPDYGPCILVNAADVPGRRAFTMAHEYAHLLRGNDASICDLLVSVSEERFADAFAAAFLMPESDVRREFARRGIPHFVADPEPLRPLCAKYGVSFEALVRRLGELGLLDRRSLDILLAKGEPQAVYRDSPKTPTWRRRLGEQYVTLAVQAHKRGQVSASKLAEYLQLDIRKVRDLVSQEHSSSSADKSKG